MIKNFLFSLYHHYYRRDKFFEISELFNQTQFWERNRVLEYQWTLFKELLAYANNNVPYYNNLFKQNGFKPSDIKDRNDLTRIPELNKDIISESYELLAAQGVAKQRIVKNATSGSTGTNLQFLSDRGAIVRTALQSRCYNWMGIDFFDRKLSIWGSGWDVKRSKKIVSRIKYYIKNSVVLSGYNLSEQDIADYYKVMTRYNPKLLISYPSIFYSLAETFENNGWEFIPKAMQIGGEKLFPFQRNYVEKIFKSKIFDFYGARDAGMIALECKEHDGLHVIAENVLVEVLDENNNPVEEGEGDLVITDLHNKVMPFIRYRIGDRAIITKKTCKCGRGLPIFKEIIGRSFEVIKFPNGNKVVGTFWTILLKTEPGIKSFQVIQKTIDHVQINYVPDEKFNKNSLDKYIEKIHKYSGDKLKISFNKVDQIPLTKAGKFKFIISELNESANKSS